MVVELDSVQDLEVNCTWKLAMLGRFMWHLEWIGNLCWLLLWHIHMLLHTALNQEEHCIARLTAQFLKLLHLQELYLDSISFLDGRLHQVLREAWRHPCAMTRTGLSHFVTIGMSTLCLLGTLPGCLDHSKILTMSLRCPWASCQVTNLIRVRGVTQVRCCQRGLLAQSPQSGSQV